jgi:hypothetical protein
MSLSAYMLALKGLVLAPLLFTAVVCLLYWKVLARPVLFLVTTCVILCILAAVSAFWLLTDLAVAGSPGEGTRVTGVGMSSSLRVISGYIGFLVLGGVGVYFLKRLFARA